ncbi:helix-turn-helix transcriptional regulator [Candidatus Kaiserbacteria bacterium]|nr:helix-turn-helix transcriptional regulator [Candidatus Kaiserbacteria bacterium]
MTKHRHVPTFISRKLKQLRNQKNLSQNSLAEVSLVSVASIKNIESGRTKRPDEITIKRLCKFFDIEPSELLEEHISTNYHLKCLSEKLLSEQQKIYGPSISEALPLGNLITSWVNYDFCGSRRYEEDNLRARLEDVEIALPDDFLNIRRKVIEENDRKKQEGQKYFFNGPSLSLHKINTSCTEDGEESAILDLRFKKSQYANNVVAKSTYGEPLRLGALSKFNYLDQPIEFLSSGVGVCVLLFTNGGEYVVLTRRSVQEQFRSLEYDVSLVEGIHPKKDLKNGIVDIYGATVRGYKEELNLDIKKEDIYLFGIGNDLMYYQWNVLGCAEIDLSWEDVAKLWHGAKNRTESEKVFGIKATPEALFSFCRDNKVWSSGMAAIYYSFLSRGYNPIDLAKVCAKVFG